MSTPIPASLQLVMGTLITVDPSWPTYITTNTDIPLTDNQLESLFKWWICLDDPARAFIDDYLLRFTVSRFVEDLYVYQPDLCLQLVSWQEAGINVRDWLPGQILRLQRMFLAFHDQAGF